MNTQNLQKQKGFTLVEIAIVLVIIGLLLGGVLKGQELITNAKIKAVTGDFDSISAAYYAFQDRTGNVAGDGADADPRVYDGAITDGSLWFDLRTEGFVSGAPDATHADNVGPTHDLDGVWSGLPGNADATVAMFTVNHICASGIQDGYAQGIDNKLDDGVATTGTIRSGSTAAEAEAYTGGEALVVVCKEL